METHRKYKKQRQPMYNAEGVIGGTLDILPNLYDLKISRINKTIPNPKFAFMVDSSGKIAGFKKSHVDKIFIDKYIDLYDSEDFLGFTNIVDKWQMYLSFARYVSVTRKNPNYLGYEPTNKLVNKIVKEKIYNKAFYKKYFRPIKIDCKGSNGACRYTGSNIILKTWADDSVLLHELAHQYGRDHDSRFATAYLMLVGRFLGHGQQIKLMDSMRKYNVEWNGTFQHSKKCFTEHGYTDRAKNAGGQCTTGATKMNLGFKTSYLH